MNYSDNQRIASRIGSGRFNNVYDRNGSYVTAGQQDYAERLNQIEAQREEYYKELGIPPGVPTMKGAYGEPENTGIGYNTIITELGDHSVPANWAQYVVKRNPGETPGPPIIWSDPQDPEDAQPGYGFIPDETTDEETFFYHSDHLGSTSYITDQDGNITQYTAYLPYGELLVDEHSSSEDLPYKFNGKELDEETGLYYYGARYLQPVANVWYGVDPLFEKYPSLSAYVYCAGNPVKYIDPDGMEIDPSSQKEWDRQKQKVTMMRDRLQAQIDKLNTTAANKGWSAEKLAGKIGDKAERLASLNSSIGTMETLEKSTQVYILSHTDPNENGSVTLKTDKNVIDIRYGGTANFVHEMTHAGQFETGDIAFSSTGMSLLQDVYDEIAAYKAQFAYSPSSISGLNSTTVANSFGAITPAWVQGLKDPQGIMPYAAGGRANTGLAPVNINSTKGDLIKAYPWNAVAFRELPANYNLRTLPGIYYKK